MSEQWAAFFDQVRDFLRRNISLLLVAGLALLAIQDVFGAHGVLAMRRAQKEAARLQQEIDRINSQNQQLQNQVKQLKSDPQTIERIAREELGLARPGEYIFKIPAQPPDASVSTPASQQTQTPQKR